MRIPSIKTLSVFGKEQAKIIRGAMTRWAKVHWRDDNLKTVPELLLERLSGVIGGCNVGFIAGHRGTKSPSIWYINMKDPHKTTIMFVGDEFVIGCLGDIVKRGDYS